MPPILFPIPRKSVSIQVLWNLFIQVGYSDGSLLEVIDNFSLTPQKNLLIKNELKSLLKEMDYFVFRKLNKRKISTFIEAENKIEFLMCKKIC